MSIVSFYDLKARNHRAVVLLLACLLFYWTAALFLAGQGIYMLLGWLSPNFQGGWMPPGWVIYLAVMALALALGHYYLGSQLFIKRVLNMFHAQPIKPEDPYHKLFRDTVDEIAIATGTTSTIQCMVIPCTSANGFALQEPSGKAIVGLTEGLLAQARRHEIQAAVAQLTARVLTRDALISTVSFSLFAGLDQFFINLFDDLAEHAEACPVSSADSNPFSFFLRAGNVINVLMAQKQVFRNDALAVKLTRDPAGLAQVLRRLQRSWRGSDNFSPLIESILFVPPGNEESDQGRTFMQKLTRAQPPLSSRLDNALAMAGKSLTEIDASLLKEVAHHATATDRSAKATDLWKACNGDTWEGPFDLAVLGTLTWLTPKTQILRIGTDRILPAREDMILASMLFGMQPSAGQEGALCPQCSVMPLKLMRYEGVKIHVCDQCQGKMVPDDDIQKILIREIVSLSPEMHLKAGQWMAAQKNQLARNPSENDSSRQAAIRKCPECSHPMRRRNFSVQYRIPIRKCYNCHVTWFEAEQLELLQALIEGSSIKLGADRDSQSDAVPEDTGIRA